MVQQKRREAQAQAQTRNAIETSKPMLISRALLALGLGGFWILVGIAFDQPKLGLACGLLGAAFIFAWTHPSWRRRQ